VRVRDDRFSAGWIIVGLMGIDRVLEMAKNAGRKTAVSRFLRTIVGRCWYWELKTTNWFHKSDHRSETHPLDFVAIPSAMWGYNRRVHLKR